MYLQQTLEILAFASFLVRLMTSAIFSEGAATKTSMDCQLKINTTIFKPVNISKPKWKYEHKKYQSQFSYRNILYTYAYKAFQGVNATSDMTLKTSDMGIIEWIWITHLLYANENDQMVMRKNN